MDDKQRILLVGGRKESRSVQRKALEQEGYLVSEAESELQALDAFANVQPDAVLLRSRLPDSRGRDICARLRTLPGGANTPVIILSPLSDKQSIERAFEAGATDYLTDPVPVPVLLHRLRILLQGMAATEQIEFLARFPDENPHPVIRIAGDGTILYANEASERLLGQWGVLNGQIAPKTLREMAGKVLTARLPMDQESTFGERIYSFAITPVTNAGYVNFYGRDITLRKRTEEALRDSEATLIALLESASEGVVLVNQAGQVVLVNAKIEEMFGYDRSELLGQSAHLLVPEGLRAGHEVLCADYFGNPRTRPMGQELDVAGRRKDGTEFPIEAGLSCMEKDDEIHALAFISDITTRKRAEEALKESERRYRLLVENATDVVFTVNVEGYFTYVNPPAARLTGYSTEELEGLHYGELIPADWRDRVQSHYVKQLDKGVHETTLEFPIITKGGEEKWVEQRAAILAEGGQVTGFQSIVRDVTERHRLEQLRAEFVSTVSHELRTPLASILGFSEALLSGSPGPLTEIQQEFMEIIDVNGRRLLGLVDDLLDVSRMDSGRLVLEIGRVELIETVSSLLQAMAPVAEEKEIKIALDMPDDGPLFIQVDRQRLEQIVNNLLSNAIKFTPERGKVSLVLRTTQPGETLAGRQLDRRGAYLKVRDTGVGIPREDMPRLFERFHRGANVRGRAFQGTGLGLNVTHGLVEAHHGQIWADSREGEGSTFHVWLPSRQPRTTEMQLNDLSSTIASKYFGGRT